MRRVLVLVALAAMPGIEARSPQEARTARPAWAIVDWASGAVLSSEEIVRLRTAVSPGSLVKMATLVAAVDAGIVTGSTRVRCDGEARVEGQAIRCSHPRLRHPLRPAEALALSCNVWFATIGARVPRARLDARLVALGLPATPRRAPMPLAATGLQANPSTPLAWVEALRRLVGADTSADARMLLVEGLRGAALFGTASAFSERGMDALAKTGTADGAGGGALGAVVAAWPASAPTRGMVLLGAGVAGRDAADLAAEIARRADEAPAPVPVAPAPTETSTRSTPAAAPPSTSIRIGVARDGGADVRAYDLEEYVARVLAGEAAAKSPPEALDALAIAVRTFAAANRGRHASEGFDLCTLTHCQVLREPYAEVREAAARTRGQVLTDESGRPAEVYYTASCGGRTERPSAVWTRAVDVPYLPSRVDRACGGEPRWAAEIPVQALDRTLAAAGYRGRLRDVEVSARSASGRATVVRLEGLVPETVSGQDLRTIVGRSLGWHLLKSTSFEVRRTGGGYAFRGRGFGHGVGLCVLGSVARARGGEDARAILAQYFPGLAISRAEAPSPARVVPARPAMTEPAPRPSSPAPVPATRVALALPASSEPERAALTSFVAEAVARLSRATALPAPPELRVVVHPSSQSFQRETAEPWWSAARTRGSRVDLVPIPVLRARGTLEATLRHELAHIVTEPVLTAAPRWVKEGVAMYFAGEPPPASLLDGEIPRRVKCPTDDELSRPVSAATAREAYGRAAACVARAIAEGKDWRGLR
jgi:stage II sporulation protein D